MHVQSLKEVQSLSKVPEGPYIMLVNSKGFGKTAWMHGCTGLPELRCSPL